MPFGRQTMYANTKRQTVEKFMDNTTGESTAQNRLTTRVSEAGNVALVAYGWLKVAEYNESRDTVTVFTGHKALNSRTVSGYLNDVINVADDRNRDVTLSGESPVVDTPNDGTRFIGSYVDFEGRSAVEEEAVEEVIESLRDL